MTREDAHTEPAVDRLIRELIIDTSRWTYASRAGLRAIAAPYERSDGQWDVVIDVQPVRAGAVKQLPNCRVLVHKVEGTPGSAETHATYAQIESGRRLCVRGLERGQYRLVPMTLSGLLHAATLHCREIWVQSHALAAAPQMKADYEVWQWQSPDSRLHGHAVLQNDGDLVFRFWSPDLSLEGVRLFVRVGIHRLPLVLVRHAEHELMGEVTLPRSVRQLAESAVAFEVEQG